MLNRISDINIVWKISSNWLLTQNMSVVKLEKADMIGEKVARYSNYWVNDQNGNCRTIFDNNTRTDQEVMGILKFFLCLLVTLPFIYLSIHIPLRGIVYSN